MRIRRGNPCLILNGVTVGPMLLYYTSYDFRGNIPPQARLCGRCRAVCRPGALGHVHWGESVDNAGGARRAVQTTEAVEQTRSLESEHVSYDVRASNDGQAEFARQHHPMPSGGGEQMHASGGGRNLGWHHKGRRTFRFF